MTENMKRFLEMVSRNEELCAKVSTAAKDELIGIAKGLDIALTDADFAQPTGELNDDELDTVAGGAECVCVMGGGGKAGTYDRTCACVLAGGGESRSGRDRCICAAGGYGIKQTNC